MTEDVSGLCILCSGRLSVLLNEVYDTRFGIPNYYSVGICNQCGVEQTIPSPLAQELKDLYETYYNFGGEKGTRYTDLRERFVFSSLYRLWTAVDGDISFHNRKGSGKLLDVGCNEGRGLRLYKQNGYLADGLELNETAAAVARSQGCTVHAQQLEEYQPQDKYNVIVLSNVLEHSLDPKGMLRHVHRILEHGGQVWISCPNNRSWLRTLFGRFWINWHVPFHVVHFSAFSLQKILEDAGFKVFEAHHKTPSLWVAHSFIARLFAKRGRPTKQLRNPLLVMLLMFFIRGLLFPLLWIGNLLGRGDCLIVTASKS
jgi:SAM-dependent methyltransferase